MRGHVRKRRTWEFIVDIGQHPVTGRRRQRSKGGFRTKKEAETAVHEFIRFMEGGGNPVPERIVLAPYLRRWLEYQRTRGIRPRTLKSYEGYIRREIVPVIGGVDLANVGPSHIRAVLTRMQQRGLAAATIAQVRSVLGSAFRQAVEDGLLSTNPVTAVKRPKLRRPDLRWPTASELAALVQTSEGTIWEVPILLAAVTGARRSEVLGISWLDVDLTRATIFIRRAVQALADADGTERAVFTPLKTKRARRYIQLPAFALERIRRHRRDQLRTRTALGSRWHDPIDELGQPVPLVCERGDGSPLYPDSFTSAFKRLARQAGLHPATRLHDVRHAVATELGRRGVHPVIVSAVLGHASPAFTMAVYQHAWQDGPAEAAAALEAALRPAAPALAIRWREEGSRRQEAHVFSQTSRSEQWGGLDSNQRPADYEGTGKALTCRNS
jgi:integrase